MQRRQRIAALLLALVVAVALGLGYVTVWGEPRSGPPLDGRMERQP